VAKRGKEDDVDFRSKKKGGEGIEVCHLKGRSKKKNQGMSPSIIKSGRTRRRVAENDLGGGKKGEKKL